jgi:hypothetical protein
MNSIKNFAVLWMLCLISTFSEGTQAQANEITSVDIKWINGEPQEIVGAVAYKRWVKDFGVIDARLAKELDYTNHSIRYVYMDVTNDGRDEIVVQEGSWAASGFAFAIFELQGKAWKTIVQHRGAFILSELDPKKPYEITLIDKDGKDYERYDLKYTKDKYRLKKKTAPYEDMSFEYFWHLNYTQSERCRSLMNFRMGGYYKSSELCNKSQVELKRDYFQGCDDDDVKAALSKVCRK